jgi:hypothetical protein
MPVRPTGLLHAHWSNEIVCKTMQWRTKTNREARHKHVKQVKINAQLDNTHINTHIHTYTHTYIHRQAVLDNVFAVMAATINALLLIHLVELDVPATNQIQSHHSSLHTLCMWSCACGNLREIKQIRRQIVRQIGLEVGPVGLRQHIGCCVLHRCILGPGLLHMHAMEVKGGRYRWTNMRTLHGTLLSGTGNRAMPPRYTLLRHLVCVSTAGARASSSTTTDLLDPQPMNARNTTKCRAVAKDRPTRLPR